MNQPSGVDFTITEEVKEYPLGAPWADPGQGGKGIHSVLHLGGVLGHCEEPFVIEQWSVIGNR